MFQDWSDIRDEMYEAFISSEAQSTDTCNKCEKKSQLFKCIDCTPWEIVCEDCLERRHQYPHLHMFEAWRNEAFVGARLKTPSWILSSHSDCETNYFKNIVIIDVKGMVSDIYKSLMTETFSEFGNFFQRTEFPENLDNGTECPACFTTLPKIYSFNADFQLVRKASFGKKWEEPKHCDKFFLDQTLVDGFIDNYYEDRGKPDVTRIFSLLASKATRGRKK
ncbi:unnamed protein product [Mytilus edulis]|uniref:Uncharacterized protein n=1 Tax=Mytilus edulis TaxID=6550 RepID=A0A8S3TF35_MYTED|nr:unnamed protein product [Mytilus edulis]